jgi:hypothetical protein
MIEQTEDWKLRVLSLSLMLLYFRYKTWTVSKTGTMGYSGYPGPLSMHASWSSHSATWVCFWNYIFQMYRKRQLCAHPILVWSPRLDGFRFFLYYKHCKLILKIWMFINVKNVKSHLCSFRSGSCFWENPDWKRTTSFLAHIPTSVVFCFYNLSTIIKELISAHFPKRIWS